MQAGSSSYGLKTTSTIGVNDLSLPDSDPTKVELINQFRENYQEAISKFEDPPSFEQVLPEVLEVIYDTRVELVVQGSEFGKKDTDWSQNKSFILIGADMLNRGFTVENLAVTYMPRHTASKSNADTIEQRCRFFGYKRKYLESCRVYLPSESIYEYKQYVEHEEYLRNKLKSEGQGALQEMLLDEMLNPTRKNILSSDLIRHKMTGWRQMDALKYVEENIDYVEKFIKAQTFEACEDYGTDFRNHRFCQLTVAEMINFLKGFRFVEFPMEIEN